MGGSMNEKIANIIGTIRPEIHIDPGVDTELFGVLDSLDIIFIVDELEKEFNIEIDASLITPEHFQTLFSLSKFIKSYMP